MQWMRNVFPLMFPSVPQVEERLHTLVLNPFIEDSEEKYKTLEVRVKPQVPESGTVDGYIKVRFSRISEEKHEISSLTFNVSTFDGHSQSSHGLRQSVEALQIRCLPPNFATGLELNAIDRTLWEFRKYVSFPFLLWRLRHLC